VAALGSHSVMKRTTQIITMIKAVIAGDKNSTLLSDSTRGKKFLSAWTI
jgi:hypothetical protein